MFLVNLLRLLFLLEQLSSENKVMEPIICLIFICLQDDIGEKGVSFLRQGPKTEFGPILAKIH